MKMLNFKIFAKGKRGIKPLMLLSIAGITPLLYAGEFPPLSDEQRAHIQDGETWVPFVLFSPPSGVIMVQMMDPQIYRFQYPPGQEHYRWGCMCNGFGVGHTTYGTRYGYTHGDASYFNLSNLGSGTATWGPTVYQWWTRTRLWDGTIEVYQQYSYCPSVGALRGRATIINLTSTTLTGVKFKRFIDWDMNPGYFSSNYFYWDGANDMCYAVANDWAHYAGLTGITPVSIYELYAWDNYDAYTSSIDYPSSYTGDGYCLLDWYIGNLPPYGTATVEYCYVGGGSYGDLITARALCGTCPLVGEDELGVEEKNIIRNPKAYYDGEYVIVKNYEGEVKIYNLSGALVEEGYVKGERKFRLPKGVYIISIKGAHLKVIVK